MKSNGQPQQEETRNKNYGNEETIGEELIHREDVENTPFTIMQIEDDYFATMGKYRLTELHKDKEKLKKELTKITWNRIVQVVSVMIQHENEIKNLTNE